MIFLRYYHLEETVKDTAYVLFVCSKRGWIVSILAITNMHYSVLVEPNIRVLCCYVILVERTTLLSGLLSNPAQSFLAAEVLILIKYPQNLNFLSPPSLSRALLLTLQYVCHSLSNCEEPLNDFHSQSLPSFRKLFWLMHTA